MPQKCVVSILLLQHMLQSMVRGADDPPSGLRNLPKGKTVQVSAWLDLLSLPSASRRQDFGLVSVIPPGVMDALICATVYVMNRYRPGLEASESRNLFVCFGCCVFVDSVGKDSHWVQR